MVKNEIGNDNHQKAGTSHYPPLLPFVNGEEDGHEQKGGEKVSPQGKKKGIEQESGHDAGPSLPPDLPQKRLILFAPPEGDLHQVNKGENPK
jgi:hypothetical protein